MKTPLILIFLSINLSYAQDKMLPFFPEITHAFEADTIPTDAFKKIVATNISDFNQAYFDYGYEDSSKWELVSKNILEYPEIGRPSANFIDLNKDGKDDIILSFRGGNYYTRLLIYFATDDGYTNIYYGHYILFGIYKNGDLSLRHPACCTDPTNEFHRISIANNADITKVDSLTISLAGIRGTSVPLDSIYHQQTWEVTKDTLYAFNSLEGNNSFSGYLPGSQMRIIDNYVFEDDTLYYAEIKGEMLIQKRYQQFFPHSFTWLSKKQY